MRATISLVATFAVASLSALAQSNPAVRTLSLDQCVVLALQHNFDIQIARYSPQIARFNLSGSYGSYDPSFTFSGEHDYDLSPGGIDSEGRPYRGTETESDRFSSDISGLLPWGLNYSLGGRVTDQWGVRPGTTIDTGNYTLGTNTIYDINTGNPSGYLISTNYGTKFVRDPFEATSGTAGALELRQPLLRNFWIDAPRLEIRINKLEVQWNDEALRAQFIRTITAVENSYYELIYSQENVRVQEADLQLASQLLAENRKRVEVGALAPLEEKQAESRVASSRATLLNAQAASDTAQRTLKNLITDEYTNSWANVSIEPTEKLVAVPQVFDLQESWRKALNDQSGLIQNRLLLKEQDERVRYSKNQLFPQLDLFGSYGYSGSGREYSGAFNQIADRSNPFYSAGAQITVPLSRTAERNNHKAQKAIRERMELQNKASEQLILITIENDVATAKTALETVEATRQATLYAEAALQAEQKKLDNGKSTSFFVLELQSKLTAARSAEIRALADYNLALAQLTADEGSTLQRHHVEIKNSK